MVAGTLFISGCPAFTLIDTGASRSFVSREFVERHGWNPVESGTILRISTPLGVKSRVSGLCRDKKVRVSERDLSVDLIVMDFSEFDVLLGIDWLTRILISTFCCLG